MFSLWSLPSQFTIATLPSPLSKILIYIFTFVCLLMLYRNKQCKIKYSLSQNHLGGLSSPTPQIPVQKSETSKSSNGKFTSNLTWCNIKMILQKLTMRLISSPLWQFLEDSRPPCWLALALWASQLSQGLQPPPPQLEKSTNHQDWIKNNGGPMQTTETPLPSPSRPGHGERPSWAPEQTYLSKFEPFSTEAQ